jgi:branched-chain amino acid transport system substrate-binding protein
MLKKVVFFALALALVFSLAACQGGGTSSGTSTGGQAGQPAATAGPEGQFSGEPIKIGYVGALTGDTALWGQAGLNGMLLRAEKINAAGGVLGRKLEVVGMDGRGDPQDSVNAFNKLIDEEKVVAVVGTNFSSCNIPMASIADAKKIPLVATAASNMLVTQDESGKLHPYSFRLCFTDPYQGSKMAEYLIAKGFKTAALIVNKGDASSTGITQYFIPAYEAAGGKIVANEEGNGGDNDFRAQLTKIAQAKPEVLFIPWIYSDVALIAKQARELGLDCQLAGSDGWDSMDLPSLAEGAMEGAIFCSRPGFALPEAQTFGEEYQAKFNITLEGECLFGSDGLAWIVQCIEEAGSAEPEAIRERLENTTLFKGLLGELVQDPATHNPLREVAIFEVQGDKEVFIEMFK